MLGDRLIVYLFPAYLIGIEIFLRSALSMDSEIFVGPVLASIGIGFLVPLTIPKNVTVEDDASIIPNNERRFIQICWIFILALTIVWIWTLFLSTTPKNYWGVVHVGYYPGVLNCLIGIILAEVKENL